MTEVPASVRAVVERYRLERDRTRDRRDGDVAAAGRDKSRLSDNYWQEAHVAQQRYMTALVIAMAFEDEP